jgi:hypothetical protein
VVEQVGVGEVHVVVGVLHYGYYPTAAVIPAWLLDSLQFAGLVMTAELDERDHHQVRLQVEGWHGGGMGWLLVGEKLGPVLGDSAVGWSFEPPSVHAVVAANCYELESHWIIN